MDTRAQPGEPSPSRDDDRALHGRLLAEDPPASSDLVSVYLAPLKRWLVDRFPAADAHLLEDAATDLLLGLAEAPRQYDPDRLGLSAYLRMAARGDVENALRSEQRRAARNAPLDVVELRQQAGNTQIEGPPDPAVVVVAGPGIDPETMALIRGSFDDREWEMVQLMADGERRYDPFAEILGIGHLSRPERERVVKRAKDRLKKRLERLAPKVRRDD